MKKNYSPCCMYIHKVLLFIMLDVKLFDCIYFKFINLALKKIILSLILIIKFMKFNFNLSFIDNDN